MLKTIDFFERKGKGRIKDDYHAKVWYSDFLDFVKKERIFATMCTPHGYGAADSRWDTWRVCEFAEILGFYGLQYWYTWQVTVLGLGPIWMSHNEAIKKRAAQALEEQYCHPQRDDPAGQGQSFSDESPPQTEQRGNRNDRQQEIIYPDHPKNSCRPAASVLAGKFIRLFYSKRCADGDRKLGR